MLRRRPSEEEALPEGWTKFFDAASGDAYYHNKATNETTWDSPARWKVGLFFETLRTPVQPAEPTTPRDGVTQQPLSRFGRLFAAGAAETSEWTATEGEDDAALRQRLSARIESLRVELGKDRDAATEDLCNELQRRRDKLKLLRHALDAEKKLASELMVASGSGGDDASRARASSARPKNVLAARAAGPDDGDLARREELEALRLQVSHMKRIVEEKTRRDEDVDATLDDIDEALADAKQLADAGVDADLAAELRLRPWSTAALQGAVFDVVAVEWQARVGNEWISPERVPDCLIGANSAQRYVPVALHASSRPLMARHFPKTSERLARQSSQDEAYESSTLFTDERGATRKPSLDALAVLPGTCARTCWQWLGGWRIDTEAGKVQVECDADGWAYGDEFEPLCLGVYANFIEEMDLDAPLPRSSAAYVGAVLRCRRWRRTRALARPPPAARPGAPPRTVALVARRILELLSHGASLQVLAAKLSDQLVKTRTALDAAERGAARVPALEIRLADQAATLAAATQKRDVLLKQLAALGIPGSSGRPAQSQASPELPSYLLQPGHHRDGATSRNNPFVDDDDTVPDDAVSTQPQLEEDEDVPPPPPPAEHTEGCRPLLVQAHRAYEEEKHDTALSPAAAAYQGRRPLLEDHIADEAPHRAYEEEKHEMRPEDDDASPPDDDAAPLDDAAEPTDAPQDEDGDVAPPCPEPTEEVAAPYGAELDASIVDDGAVEPSAADVDDSPPDEDVSPPDDATASIHDAPSSSPASSARSEDAPRLAVVSCPPADAFAPPESVAFSESEDSENDNMASV
ncbi:hypothetical protein M885DRAFT_508985 [Pelagophyceae sp. CCMP2097]|nr:hypothetical protein M885DRAFT_508985 [Pelagophyceae sp. CCMP2097]